MADMMFTYDMDCECPTCIERRLMDDEDGTRDMRSGRRSDTPVNLRDVNKVLAANKTSEFSKNYGMAGMSPGVTKKIKTKKKDETGNPHGMEAGSY